MRYSFKPNHSNHPHPHHHARLLFDQTYHALAKTPHPPPTRPWQGPRTPRSPTPPPRMRDGELTEHLKLLVSADELHADVPARQGHKPTWSSRHDLLFVQLVVFARTQPRLGKLAHNTSSKPHNPGHVEPSSPQLCVICDLTGRI